MTSLGKCSSYQTVLCIQGGLVNFITKSEGSQKHLNISIRNLDLLRLIEDLYLTLTCLKNLKSDLIITAPWKQKTFDQSDRFTKSVLIIDPSRDYHLGKQSGFYNAYLPYLTSKSPQKDAVVKRRWISFY